MICPIKLVNDKYTDYTCESECALFDKQIRKCMLRITLNFIIDYLYTQNVLFDEMIEKHDSKKTRKTVGN